MPGKQGVELLAGVHQRGARVVVITNSLASTDGVPVHSKYQLYRKALVEAGVELYEIKPTAGAQLEAALSRTGRIEHRRACTRRRSPSTAGLVSSAPTISIRARAN